jgi:hypothetical protein
MCNKKQPDKAIISDDANRMYEIPMTKGECMAVSMYRMIEWLLLGVNNISVLDGKIYLYYSRPPPASLL